MSNRNYSEKTILFLSYGGGHAEAIAPVIKEITQEESHKIIVMSLTTANVTMAKYDIPFVSFKDFAHLVSDTAKDIGHNLVGLDSASSLVPHLESVYYHGINMLDLIESVGEETAYEQFDSIGRQSFYPRNFMIKLLKYLSVDLLVTTNSPRTEMAAVDAAGSLGIKSICIVDLFAKREVEWLGRAGFATKICVLNNSVKQMLLNSSRKENEIVVTGNPSFDNLTKEETILSGQLFREQKGWANNELITLLYASQPEPKKHPFCDIEGDPELPKKIEHELRDFIENNSNFRLVVRHHPSESREFLQQERVYRSLSDENLHCLLHAVDIVIVTASTVGLEASLIGKLVLSVDCSIFSEDAPYSEMGISKGTKDPSTLGSLILSEAKDYIRKDTPVENNNATGKILQVIDSLI